MKYQFAWNQVVSETDVESQLDHKEELKLTQLIYMKSSVVTDINSLFSALCSFSVLL